MAAMAPVVVALMRQALIAEEDAVGQGATGVQHGGADDDACPCGTDLQSCPGNVVGDAELGDKTDKFIRDLNLGAR